MYSFLVELPSNGRTAQLPAKSPRLCVVSLGFVSPAPTTGRAAYEDLDVAVWCPTILD